MAVRVKEVDRLEYPVMRRAEHVDPLCLDMCLGRQQRSFVGHAESEVLDPLRGVGILAHFRLVR